METENIIKFCGSITKTESLIPITTNILAHTWVAEANLPYAGYYGQVPERTKANSLFLFTNKFYPLEEILRITEAIKNCFTDNIDAASAILEFQKKQYPAIRIKNFPDYVHLHLLQKCFNEQGIEFEHKLHFFNQTKAIINKCFEIKKSGEGIYFDQQEINKGYLFLENRLDRDTFESAVVHLKNNCDRRYFDVVPGVYIKDSRTIDFLRIYSEGLNPEVLDCIKLLFQKINIPIRS